MSFGAASGPRISLESARLGNLFRVLRNRTSNSARHRYATALARQVRSPLLRAIRDAGLTIPLLFAGAQSIREAGQDTLIVGNLSFPISSPSRRACWHTSSIIASVISDGSLHRGNCFVGWFLRCLTLRRPYTLDPVTVRVKFIRLRK